MGPIYLGRGKNQVGRTFSKQTDIQRSCYIHYMHLEKVKNKFVNFLFTNSELEEVTFYKTTICFFSLFIITLALSIFLYVEISTVKEIRKEYYTPSGSCSINTTCTVTIEID